VGADYPVEVPQSGAAPSVPKETVQVEALQMASSEEAEGVELEPIRPPEDGSAPHSGDRSAEGMEVAKALSQPNHSAAPAREAPPPSRQAMPPVVERIVEKMVDTLQAGAGQKRHEVSLQLHPPSLGKVHLTILVEDWKLQVALFTDNSQARDLVESNASHLRAALHQQGLELDRFSVEVRSGLAQTTTQQDWSGWREGFSAGPSFRGGQVGAQVAAAAAQPVSYARRDALARIDLFI